MDRRSLWSILFSQGWCLWAWLRPAYTKLASGARDKCRHADIQRGYSHYLATSFGASHLSYIDQNRIMWLSVDVGQNISQGQSVAQSIIPVHFLYSIRHHWYSTGNLCALGIWKLKSPPPVQLYKPVSFRILTYLCILKMSWITIRLFTRKCFHRNQDFESRCRTYWICKPAVRSGIPVCRCVW